MINITDAQIAAAREILKPFGYEINRVGKTLMSCSRNDLGENQIATIHFLADKGFGAHTISSSWGLEKFIHDSLETSNLLKALRDPGLPIIE